MAFLLKIYILMAHCFLYLQLSGRWQAGAREQLIEHRSNSFCVKDIESGKVLAHGQVIPPEGQDPSHIYYVLADASADNVGTISLDFNSLAWDNGEKWSRL